MGTQNRSYTYDRFDPPPRTTGAFVHRSVGNSPGGHPSDVRPDPSLLTLKLFSRFRISDHGVHQPNFLVSVIDAIPKPPARRHFVLPLLHRLAADLTSS
jgi:hypothetical protein